MSGVFYPRFRVSLNGAALSGVETLSFDLASALSCGRFNLTKILQPGDDFPPSFWEDTDLKTMIVQIDMATDGVSFSPAFTGRVDNHTWHAAGYAVDIAGRDMAAPLQEAKVTQTYRNNTSSDLATMFATAAGLTPNVTKTTTLIGRYYDRDHDQVQAVGDGSGSLMQWDLLTRLARQEGFILFVSGMTLNFIPPPANPPIFDVIYSTNANGGAICNVEDPTFTRNLTQARDVVVTVISWHSRMKATHKATVRTRTRSRAPAKAEVVTIQETASTKTKSAGAKSSDKPAIYYIKRPNLTPAQAMALAQREATEISQHERYHSFNYPSYLPLTPLHAIRVSGTGTDADMTYYPQTISTQLSRRSVSTSVRCKFSSSLMMIDDDTGQEIGSQ